MLKGRFGSTTGRPYFDGRLVLPRLKISGDVSFILDTGADVSVLMPLDAGRPKIDYASLSDTTDTLGIGGLSKDFVEPAFLAFTDSGVTLYAYEISLHIATASPDIMKVPSLLGRNILDNWTITYDKPNGILQAVVVNADLTYDLAAGPPTTS